MPPTERKDFETTKKLREVMGNYFADLGRGAAEGKKTAWCTSVGPAELLWALGFPAGAVSRPMRTLWPVMPHCASKPVWFPSSSRKS